MIKGAGVMLLPSCDTPVERLSGLETDRQTDTQRTDGQTDSRQADRQLAKRQTMCVCVCTRYSSIVGT